MAFMIYRKGRFRKNKQFSDSDHNQPCRLEKIKNTENRKMGQPSYFTVVETLVQRDGFPLIQLSNEAFCFSPFLPN